MAETPTVSLATLQSMIADLVKIVTLQQTQMTQQGTSVHSGNSGGARGGISGISFDRFNEEVEDFDTYIERLSAFFEVQGVPKERKVSCFVSLIGPKLFTLLKNLLHPEKFNTKTFEQLKELLKTHLNPTPLVIPSRHAFLNRKQHEGESLACYVAELRRLALPCKYSVDMLNTMMRDVFVSGLRSKAILDRVFENDDITFDKTLELAYAIEKATSGANEILQSEQPKIHKVDSRKHNDQKKYKSNYQKGLRCLRCARENHTAKNCRAKNLFCNFCKIKNSHVESVCFRKAKATDQSVKEVKEDSNENTEEPLPLYTVYDNHRVPPMIVPVKLNGKSVQMEVDTGAAATIINRQVFDTIPSLHSGILHPTTTTFKSYNQQQITPLGEAVLQVMHKTTTKDLRLFVVEGNYTSIMGREWISALGILPIPVNLVSQDLTLDGLLNKYSPLFEKQVNAVKNYTYSVELVPDAKPVFKRARPVAYMLLPAVEKELQRLENEGMITKTTISDWATPIVPVRKPNGDIRICGDYSGTVNPQIKVAHHPFPSFEEVSAKLTGGKSFSKCDITTAFLHLPVCPKSAEILTINTHKGLYKVHRLLFGCSSAPAIWQRYIDGLLKDLPGVIVVHDDIIITGENEKQHLDRLENLFKKLVENGIRLNPEKCKFLQTEVKFLGYTVCSEGVKKTTERIDAVLKCKTPTCVKEVQSFMGMVNFYAKFAKNLATLAEPLYQLTRKSDVPFNWTEEHEKCFKEIKKEVASDKILIHYDSRLPLVLSVDASPVGLGAVLAHRIGKIERPIAFVSRTLNASERNYSQIDKEATAIRWGVDKFFNYLFANKFILVTDHQALFHIFGRTKRSKLPSHTATRLLHYAIYLQMFEFDIEYRKSEHHGNADFLSRLPMNSKELESADENTPAKYDDVAVFHLEQINTLPVLPKDVRKATLEDPETQELYKKLQLGISSGPNSNQYSLQGGCIFNGIRVYIPNALQPKILQELHDGHMGIVKMKALARSVVYWPKIDLDIETTGKNCIDCAKIQRQPSKVEKHFWEYPSHPWERIHCDHAGPFMGHMFFLIVDAHSKWLETFIVKSTSSKEAMDILETLFARYGLPRTLVSDNGTAFTSHQFQKFVNVHGIKHITTAPFHPASNGQAERYVSTLKQALRAMKNHEGGLHHRLNVFLMAYRRTPNITTGESLAKLFLQREIRTKIDILKPDPVRDVADRLRKNNVTFSERKFKEGETVAVRDYRSPDKKWTFGKVMSQDGNLQNTISVDGQLWRRHLEQMKACAPTLSNPPTSTAQLLLPSALQDFQPTPEEPKGPITLPKSDDRSYSHPNSSPRKSISRRSFPPSPGPTIPKSVTPSPGPASPSKSVARRSIPTQETIPEMAKKTSVPEKSPKPTPEELRRSARPTKKPIRFRNE